MNLFFRHYNEFVFVLTTLTRFISSVSMSRNHLFIFDILKSSFCLWYHLYFIFFEFIFLFFVSTNTNFYHTHCIDYRLHIILPSLCRTEPD